MGYDLKYGKVTTERKGGDIPDDEIVIVFRARDAMLPGVLRDYMDRCEEIGAPHEHIRLVAQTLAAVMVWQEEHRHRVMTPTSAAYLAASAVT